MQVHIERTLISFLVARTRIIYLTFFIPVNSLEISENICDSSSTDALIKNTSHLSVFKGKPETSQKASILLISSSKTESSSLIVPSSKYQPFKLDISECVIFMIPIQKPGGAKGSPCWL